MVELIALLLPIAFLSGWRLARKRYKQTYYPEDIPKNFVQGVNYLFKEQPDKALDILLNYPDIDEHTADTFISLGNLFRNRGEVNRALRVHQHLVARADLSREHRVNAMYALGEDFFAAGLLDRAERVFTEIRQGNPKLALSCEPLRHIYEKLQDWDKAIEVVDCSTQDLDERKRLVVHYLCEQAQVSLNAQQLYQAEHKLDLAAQSYNSARVKVLLGDLALKRDEKAQALQHYQQAVEQEPRLLEVLAQHLLEHYVEPAELKALYDFALQCYDNNPNTRQVLAPLLTIAVRAKQVEAVLPVVKQALQQGIPTSRALARASRLLGEMDAEAHCQHTQQLAEVMQRMSASQPEFQCGSCGYKMHDFLWRCPACHRWDTVKSH